MSLPWVRLDCAFPYNPKLLAMLSDRDGKRDANRDGYRAAVTYLSSLCYAGQQGSDGFIPREALPFCHGRNADAESLVRHGFWRPQPGGWLINGWDEFQESNDETKQRRARAQAGAAARWEGHEAATHAERQRQYRQRQKSMQNGVGDDAK